MTRLAAAAAYFGLLAYFILGFLLVNLWILPVALFTRGKLRRRDRVAGIVTGSLAHFRRLLVKSGVVRIEFENQAAFEALRGHVVVANHPSILDAPLLLASDPSFTCFFKANLRRTMGGIPAAVLAGYIPNDAGSSGLMEAARRLREGANVIIFPEGTRSTGTLPDEFGRASALLALRAGAPVTCLTFRYSSPLLSKRGGPLAPPKHFPLVIRIRQVVTLDAQNFGGAHALTREMSRVIREDLAGDPTPFLASHHAAVEYGAASVRPRGHSL